MFTILTDTVTDQCPNRGTSHDTAGIMRKVGFLKRFSCWVFGKQFSSFTMNANSVPTWVSMVREQDGSHSVYLEQRSFNCETLVTTTNQGLCFNTEEWSIFALQIAGIDQALKLAHEEEQRRLLSHNIAAICGLEEPPPLQPLPPDGKKRTKKQL